MQRRHVVRMRRIMLTVHQLSKWPPLQTDMRRRDLVQPRRWRVCTGTVYGQTFPMVAQTDAYKPGLKEIKHAKPFKLGFTTSICTKWQFFRCMHYEMHYTFTDQHLLSLVYVQCPQYVHGKQLRVIPFVGSAVA